MSFQLQIKVTRLEQFIYKNNFGKKKKKIYNILFDVYNVVLINW